MAESWETIDLYKALAALLAGLVLGLERELKDKSAGLKTMTIICLGSALFAIVSLKVGTGTSDPGRIAANIITGIGFLGAGVIFKEGFTVHGLTTAGIIWISSAIGMSIGFGQFYLALTFLLASLLVIYSSRLINALMVSKHQTSSRLLTVSIHPEKVRDKKQLTEEIAHHTSQLTETLIRKNGKEMQISFEIRVTPAQHQKLESFLLENPDIIGFSYQ